MAKLDLSLTAPELESFLSGQRTIRLATATPTGQPHVVPLWFVWVDRTVFMNSTLGNVTIQNLERNPAATGSVDDGEAYEELRGVLPRPAHVPAPPSDRSRRSAAAPPRNAAVMRTLRVAWKAGTRSDAAT